VKPLVNELSLLGIGNKESLIDDFHADRDFFTHSDLFVGVDPVHDEFIFFFLAICGTCLSDFSADGVASAFLSGNRDIVFDLCTLSFDPVNTFRDIFLEIIPDVQVHEGGFSSFRGFSVLSWVD